MKKTLITLAALAAASVASAAVSLDDAVVNVGSPSVINQTFSGTGASYTLTFVIDWDKAVESLGIWSSKSEVKIGSGSGLWWNHGFTMFKGHDGDADSLYTGFMIDGKATSPTQGAGASLPGDGANIEYKAANYKTDAGTLVLNMVYDGASDTYTLGALKNDGTITYATASKDWAPYSNSYVTLGTPEGVVQHVFGFSSALSTDDLATISTAAKAVPEPATATLSLLALAGLAARRRRK